MNSTKRILVIDDSAELQAAMSMVLDLEGYQPLSASNGSQALDMISEYRPDMIFLDMYMPGMDGWAFLDAYFQKAGHRAPIVGMSGEILHPDALPGIDGFMPKPYTAQQMLAHVRQHTGHQKLPVNAAVCTSAVMAFRR
jgi:CheY-like chemotaxis protein